MTSAPWRSSSGAKRSGGVARDPGALRVDGVQLVGDAERPELDAIGAERVRLDDVRARADVFLVHFGDQIRLRHVQRIEALVDEHALRIQHRPHCAVEEHERFMIEQAIECG